MIHGTIERRVLLNYRLDPATLQRSLPRPFRPKLYQGYGIGGICIIRFSGLRPRIVPRWLGLSSENAAHRIAVEWDQDGQLQEGFFIPRRDTSSFFNRVLGGRVFPGIFEKSRFTSQEENSSIEVQIVREDGVEEVGFAGQVASRMPGTSVFPALADAAGFFSLGATGYSATHAEGHYHGMELRCLDWSNVPLAIKEARSCFFDDQDRFPPGTARPDCALLMRGIAHEWHSRPNLYLSDQGNSLTVLHKRQDAETLHKAAPSV